MPDITLLNCDCMTYMATCEDNAFDLAIVDPPYGISAVNMNMGAGYCDGKTIPKEKNQFSRNKNKLSKRIGSEKAAGKLAGRTLNTMPADWDMSPPKQEYFEELKRIAENQIIWGGNYFDLPPTRCILCWDKQQPWENFSQWEMAWTSFSSPARMFRRGNGLQEPGKIHPTQKPVKLYDWLLTNYAEPGQKILDTHLGSGSSAIAAHYFGVDFVGIEIDKDYYNAACKRFEQETAQLDIFG